MDAIKVLVKATWDSNALKDLGSVGLALGAGSLALAGVLYYPAKLVHWNYVGVHRDTVCWKHYESLQIAYLQPDIYAENEIARRAYKYRTCIQAARKGKELEPLD
jgi:hypothetical protein